MFTVYLFLCPCKRVSLWALISVCCICLFRSPWRPWLLGDQSSAWKGTWTCEIKRKPVGIFVSKQTVQKLWSVEMIPLQKCIYACMHSFHQMYALTGIHWPFARGACNACKHWKALCRETQLYITLNSTVVKKIQSTGCKIQPTILLHIDELSSFVKEIEAKYSEKTMNRKGWHWSGRYSCAFIHV